MDKLIIGKNMVKIFDEVTHENSKVLNHVDVEIASGEFVAIMGPSGSGKSTLLFSLSGTDTLSKGSVSFNGQELATLKENQLADLRRTEMGFVFQHPTMLKTLNILDNIILPVVQQSSKDKVADIEKAQELMREAKIDDLQERSITKVSGGQLQRAGICRALISSPKIIFADEPTGALNSRAAEEIMEMFATINKKGTAILLVTHDAKVAARAERVLFMKDGQIVSHLSLNPRDSIEEKQTKVSEEMRKVE